jgi:hypothetical protein
MSSAVKRLVPARWTSERTSDSVPRATPATVAINPRRKIRKRMPKRHFDTVPSLFSANYTPESLLLHDMANSPVLRRATPEPQDSSRGGRTLASSRPVTWPRCGTFFARQSSAGMFKDVARTCFVGPRFVLQVRSFSKAMGDEPIGHYSLKRTHGTSR